MPGGDTGAAATGNGASIPGPAEAALFLLAHQDDEIMVAPLMTAEKRRGRTVAVIYLTNGDGGGVAVERRNAETARCLASLGVDHAREVLFLGTERAISDGTLYRDLQGVHAAILAHALTLPTVAAVYVHAWEGGNPDHDAGHALGLGVAHALGGKAVVWQVPFYRAPRLGPLPFLLFAPLVENGPVAYHRLGMLQRIGRLLAVRYFPSQARTFMRFLPLMILDAVFKPGVALQGVAPTRLFERPMRQPLRYERIGYVRFADMAPDIRDYWQWATSAGDAAAARTAAGGYRWMHG